MPIRQQIVEQESIVPFEKSAEEHYEAGFSLLAAGFVVGIDEMALAAEMLLKAAYFRYAGFPLSLPIKDADRQAAKTLAASSGVQEPVEAYHNLNFWVEAIIAVRNNGFAARTHYSGSVLPSVAPAPTNESILRVHAGTLRENYSISDRYLSRQALVTQNDIDAVFEAAMGILNLYDDGIL